MSTNSNQNDDFTSIAIIGMSGRFPGADMIGEYWDNLLNGVEMIKSLSEEDMLRAGADPTEIKLRNYVNAAALLDDIECFDASFFGFSEGEALIMDPQHRVFLECAWEALEQSGYCTGRNNSIVGVFASSSMSSYLMYNLAANPKIMRTFGSMAVEQGNSKDFMPSRVAYKLNLKGPCVAIQNGCSSSLAAVHFGVQSLLNYQCDIAVVGGASIRLYTNRGYLYQNGGMLSPDGHCYPFDEKAQGTVGGNGVGVVVLKRLSDAISDGDYIHAVIKGTGISNDGAEKAGFTTPGYYGQVEAVRNAYNFAGVGPETISYIEAQGVGTPLGDSIEVAALNEVFSDFSKGEKFCAIGSVKSLIGHLDVAAGIAGLIKTALILKNRAVPPNKYFHKPNPSVPLDGSVFYVNQDMLQLQRGSHALRAAVNCFGIGGTNVHVVMEEASAYESNNANREETWRIIPLSAQSQQALMNIVLNLKNYLKAFPEWDIGDIAYTLQIGRKHFKHRCAFLVRNNNELLDILDKWEKPECKNIIGGLSVEDMDVISSLIVSNSKDESFTDSNKVIKGLKGEFSDYITKKESCEQYKLLSSIVHLWCEGVEIEWEKFNGSKRLRRIPLPTYPFERKRFWIDPIVSNNNDSKNCSGEYRGIEDIRKSNGANDSFQQLIELVQDLIGNESIDTNKGFFELGGSSLLGVRLLINIQSKFNIEVPMEVLYKNISIKELYSLIKSNQAEKDYKASCNRLKTPLVYIDVLTEGTDEKTFLCVPPLSGVSPEYSKDRFSALANALQPNQGFCCLQSPTLKSDSVVLDANLHMRAEECGRILLDKLPYEPYILGGWCNGGVLAFEIAKLLTQYGKKVKKLVLFDSYEPTYLKEINCANNKGIVDMYDEMLFIQSFLIEMNPSDMSLKSPKIIDEIAGVSREERTNYIISKLKNIEGMGPKVISRIFDKYYKIYKDSVNKNKTLFDNYSPGSYEGDILIFKAINDGGDSPEYYLGWDKVCKGNINVHEVEGNHFTMLLEPNISKVAQILQGYL